MDTALANRCTELNTTVGRLSLLSAHDALILLKASFSAPKMMHTMRCSPCVNHPAFTEYDNLVRTGIFAAINLDLSDLQWLHASLPVKEGRLGVRRVTSLAPSAFLAYRRKYRRSPAAAVTSQSDGGHYRHSSLTGDLWSSAVHNSPLSTGLSAHKQSAWDKPTRSSADADNRLDALSV